MLLSFPFIPLESSLVRLGYEGIFTIHQGTTSSDWGGSKAQGIEAKGGLNEQTLRTLQPLLPSIDAFKVIVLADTFFGKFSSNRPLILYYIFSFFCRVNFTTGVQWWAQAQVYFLQNMVLL